MHILSEKNFKKGQKPAVNYGLSVSRLGGAVQKPSIKTVGAVVRRELLSYLETADVYQLVKVDSMSSDLQEKIYRGTKMLELLKQPEIQASFKTKDTYDMMEKIIDKQIKRNEKKCNLQFLITKNNIIY